MKVKVEANKCVRCGHIWVNRKTGKTKKCPKCNSPYWDTPIIRKSVSLAQKKRKR